MEIEMNKEVPQITYDEGKLVYYVNKKEYHHDFQCSSEELKALINPRVKVLKKNLLAFIIIISLAITFPLLTQPQLEFNIEAFISGIGGFLILIIITLIKLMKVHYNFKNATKIGDLITPTNNPILELDNVGVRLYDGITLKKSINWRDMKFIGIYEKCILFSSSKRDQMFYISSSYKEKIIKQLKDMEYDFLIADNR